MYHAEDGYLAATNELMSLHVSESTRRSAPMAPEILERLVRIQAAHDPLPRPPQGGRMIGFVQPTQGGWGLTTVWLLDPGGMGRVGGAAGRCGGARPAWGC